MNRLFIGCSTLVIGLLVHHDLVAQTETQSFASEQAAADAGWFANDEANNLERGCDDCVTAIGWKDTDFAGGDAGEGGGTLHRSGNLPVGFYGDLSIGSLSLNTAIEASGKIILTNIDFDGSAHVGFFDGFRLNNDPLDYGAHLAFSISEPGGGVDPNFRWSGQVRTNDGRDQGAGSFTDGIFDDEALEFSIEYHPNEGDFGTMRFSIGDDVPVEAPLSQEIREAGVALTAFGIFTSPFVSSADSRSLEILIDDVTYTSLGTSITLGDFNSDGEINLDDFQVLASNFNTSAADFSDGDIDFNGSVDGADFTAFRAIFAAQPSGAATIPEPASGALALATVLGLLVARKRRG